MSRPALNDSISVDDFTSFYWLKKELTAFCRNKRISASGSKTELAGRIKEFLTDGTVQVQPKNETKRATSTFNWNTADLSLDTILTDNYKSTENVRVFLTSQIGNHFHFTVGFMQWAKQNTGKTLADAIAEWNKQYELKKGKHFKTEIAPQFEYNRYIRAFLDDNLGKTAKDAMQFWKLKRALRGSNEYAKSDLLLRSA